MILTCSACDTRYRVGEEDLAAPDGRMVRCANCGHSWRQALPATGARADEAASIIVRPSDGPVFGSPPRPVSASRLELSPRAPPALPPRTDRSRFAATALGRKAGITLVLVVLAVLAGMLARHYLAAVWPPAWRLYGWIGLPVEPAGAGLAIEKIAPVRSGDGLVIDGEIANRGGASQDVPRLRVALQDAAEQEVQFKIVDPPKARLRPGETVHFAAPFAHPADDATGVVVTFASR